MRVAAHTTRAAGEDELKHQRQATAETTGCRRRTCTHHRCPRTRRTRTRRTRTRRTHRHTDGVLHWKRSCARLRPLAHITCV